MPHSRNPGGNLQGLYQIQDRNLIYPRNPGSLIQGNHNYGVIIVASLMIFLTCLK